MAVQGSNNGIRNVSVPQTPAADVGQPGVARPAVQTPARDIRQDANQLNKIAPTNNFRAGSVLARNIGASSPAERALPGGNITAAWGRAEEFGDVADLAAARVAANHPDIFGA